MKTIAELPAAQLKQASGTQEISQPATRTRRPRRMARDSSDGVPVEQPTPAPRQPSKIDQVLALLSRPEGATLAEMIEATGWLPHTTRAALTGLRKKDHVLAKDKRGDVTCYRIIEAAS